MRGGVPGADPIIITPKKKPLMPFLS